MTADFPPGTPEGEIAAQRLAPVWCACGLGAAETWTPVVGFEGRYEVSDHGRVRSLSRWINAPNPPNGRRRIKGCLMKPSRKDSGHLQVQLREDGNGTFKGVHVLVLTAFAGPRPEGMEACHGDGVPSNNHLSNLRWDTRSANMHDRVKHGVHPQASKERCKWGHLLVAPNLLPVSTRPSSRPCRACNRTHASQSYARRNGRPFHFELEAERQYRDIMGGFYVGT